MVHDIPISVKGDLVDAGGVPYREFKAALNPRYGLIWLQIGLGYLVLVVVIAGLALWDPAGWLAVIAAGLAGGVPIGYTIASLSNFFHESAHYNLLPSRRANDNVTNLLMGWLYGLSIFSYREIHFQHHRALGTTMDSENSYFDPLRVRYLVAGLLGIKALRTLRRYGEVEDRRARSGQASTGNRPLWVLIAVAAHLLIIGGSAALGAWAAAAAWAIGALAIFPFFASLRQVLEHRDEEADAAIDYRQVDHGATNRIFGDGPLASTMGSAGFNRHALHHWEPQVSYTRLRDLEDYLLDTELRSALLARQTSYRATLLRLLQL